jgi:hypothetical protein
MEKEKSNEEDSISGGFGFVMGRRGTGADTPNPGRTGGGLHTVQ